MSRDDKGNSTMPLSESQVVAVSEKPAVDKHDRSVWKGLVVGADEFAPPPKPHRSRARWLVAGLLVAGAGGVAAYELTGSGESATSATAPSPSPSPTPSPNPSPSPSPSPSPAPTPVATPPALLPADAAASSPAPDDAAPRPDAATVERSATRPAAVVPVKRKRHLPPKKHPIRAL
jgi:hypothetical protein